MLGLNRIVGSKVTILTYHSVNPEPDKYSVSPEAFLRQIQLVQSTYPIIPLKDIGNHLVDSNERRVAITFDDAFDDFAAFAHPILTEYKAPATVFVPTGLVGKSNEWDRRDRSISPKRVMSAQELRALSQDSLIDWGSHTVDHVSMRKLSREEMRRQATDSRRELEDILGRPISMFSYPHGQRRDVSAAAEKALIEAGYDLAVTTFWGTRNSKRDMLKLRRIWLNEDDTLATMRAKIDGWQDWRTLKEIGGFALWSGTQALSAFSRRDQPRGSA